MPLLQYGDTSQTVQIIAYHPVDNIMRLVVSSHTTQIHTLPSSGAWSGYSNDEAVHLLLHA